MKAQKQKARMHLQRALGFVGVYATVAAREAKTVDIAPKISLVQCTTSFKTPIQ
jgi:1-deoxy-D-xylulose 5-phosphate reductoisomerase